MGFELSYAGVGLCVPTAEVSAYVASVLPTQALTFPGPLGWPASSLAGLTAFTAPIRRRGKIGSLYWPSGASRPAVGYFLASWTQLESIRAVIGDGNSAPFVLDSGGDGGSVTTDLYMLPPLPITGGIPSLSDPNDPLYLITLVDERFFWWRAITDDNLTVTDDETTWNDLIDALATLLGISITADTVADGFGFAPNGLDLSGLPAAPVLDAICYACGLRVSRTTIGNVHASGADTDYGTIASNIANDWPSESGGPFRLDPDGLPDVTGLEADDQPLILPETVRIVFLPTADDPHVIDVLMSDQDDLLDHAPSTGLRAWTTRRDSISAGEDDEEAYTAAFARDYGIRLISAVSRRFAGIVPWVPEGTSEAVEWFYSGECVATTVHPAVWSDGITEVVGTAGSANETGSFSIIHVTGRPQNTVPGPRRWYPGAVSKTDPDSWIRSDSTTVRLIQIKDAELATNGPGYYVAKRLRGRVEFEGTRYPVYETDQRLRLLSAYCDPDNPGVILNVTEGLFEGDADDGSAPFGGYDFSSADDSGMIAVLWY